MMDVNSCVVLMVVHLTKVSTWNGRPITELSKKELIEVIEYLGKEREVTRLDHLQTVKFLSSI
jgi:hypothetical protein